MNISEQLDLLCSGTEHLHNREELQKKLTSGRPLRVKFGVDPTAPDIHLGHTVPLLKLRQFQDLGHLAVLIIGDFTASIGDPTGRDSTRPELSAELIAAHARTYQDQAFKVLDPAKTEVRWNRDWFGKMTLEEMLDLMRRRAVSQILQRRDFKERLASGGCIMMHELQYPLMQGWDSVVVQADVELGGTEQLFNLLMGRDLQLQMEQEPQIVMTLPLLEGIDGVEKMSKSKGNTIGVTEPPTEMFGKTMRISDELMTRWYPTLFHEALDSTMHPMEAKKQLAQRIVARFHSAEAGREAREQFERIFSQHEIPTEMPEFTFSESSIGLVKIMTEIKAATSGSEARRLVAQGGVSVDGQKITDPQFLLTLGAKPVVLKCGKRFFARVRLN